MIDATNLIKVIDRSVVEVVEAKYKKGLVGTLA